MAINKNYAVFGLGRYGLSVAKELVANGAEVLAVDSDENIVNDMVHELPICKCADVTDSDVIEQLGISNMDIVIIAMASRLETSVMATTLCKEAGVPMVIVKCANEMHQKILSRVGADKVVIPEQESGIRLAKNLLSSDFVDIIDLSENISMVEYDVKPDWVGKNLIDLNLRKKYAMNVVAIKKKDEVSIDVNPEMPLTEDMKLIIVADTNKLKKIK